MNRIVGCVAASVIVLAAAALAPVRLNPPDEEALSKTLLVTGTGMDPEKAELDAILQAAQKVVGLYLDAKEVLKDDKLSEQILTFTCASIYSAERTKEPQKQKNGLWQVEMKITIAVTELKAKLKTLNFAVKAVPGEEIAKKMEQDAKLREFQDKLDKKSAVNLGELLGQFSLAKMLKPADNLRPGKTPATAISRSSFKLNRTGFNGWITGNGS